MMEQKLMAGAGRAVIPITPYMLPLDGFTQVHDELHIRVLILQQKIRFAIVSVEITSMFPPTQKKIHDLVQELTGAEHIWITLTHSFAGPHIWPAPEPGMADRPRPGHKERAPEEIARCALLEQAYMDATRQATEAALRKMCPVQVGWGTGICKVNASRNIQTKDGWWIGTDDTQPCDHSLQVLRIDRSNDRPLALLYVYGMRSCVTSRIKGADGGMQISSDLCGAACSYLEQNIGEDFTALFLCGPAGDQEPRLKGVFQEPDEHGELHSFNLGQGAYALLDAQGIRLGSAVLQTYGQITDLHSDVSIHCDRKVFTCKTKKMERNLSRLKPTGIAEFEPEGSKELAVYAAKIGQFQLVGVQPEIDGVTGKEIAQAFPDRCSAVAIMVNGGDKCMPEEQAYADVKYQSLNSPFMPGSAECLRDTAIELLKSI